MKLEMGKMFEFSSTFIESLHQDFEQWENVKNNTNLKVYKKKDDEEDIDPYLF